MEPPPSYRLYCHEIWVTAVLRWICWCEEGNNPDVRIRAYKWVADCLWSLYDWSFVVPVKSSYRVTWKPECAKANPIVWSPPQGSLTASAETRLAERPTLRRTESAQSAGSAGMASARSQDALLQKKLREKVQRLLNSTAQHERQINQFEKTNLRHITSSFAYSL